MNNKVAIYVRAYKEGNRVSLRSNNNIDVNEVAKLFGCGGHKNAAGFLIKKDLESAKKDVVEAVEKYLKNLK